jgi:hypothetical protein
MTMPGLGFSLSARWYVDSMSEIAMILVVLGFFLALKAIEHRGDPPMYPLCSIGAWISFGVGLILWLVL